MNVPLSFTGPQQFTAESVGVPPPDCGGGTPYIDSNTGMWDCTPPPPPPPSTSSSGSATILLLAAAVAGYLFWHYGSKAQKTIGGAAKGAGLL
jgi:hypothetical protein